LLASEGALVAVSDVPEGVRDVLRRRLSRLPPPAVAVLRLAATVGHEADVEVLVDAADTDEDGVIAGLEAGVIAGLLTEPGPGRVRLVHALVRDTVYADLTQLRLTRMHARVGAAIAVGDRAAAEALVADLTPVAGMLAGAASTALAMQPMAQTLGELSAFLDRPEAAARYFAAAEQVARRWNSPHWTARAQAAARQCPPNG
jgi:predicted ATPase